MATPNEPQRIIAIGASAGGIEALYSFFDHTPLDTVAYVVIQHLSSEHQSRLAELLKKYSKLQVLLARQDMPVETNRVYIIPSKSYLTIEKGRLKLSGKHFKSRPHMTIDTFFTSLAADQGNKAIGVILSGTGKDGSEGIKAIGKAGGWVLVQDPASAQYDQMPKSAISTGWVNSIGAIESMPIIIQAYVHGGAPSNGYAAHSADAFRLEAGYKSHTDPHQPGGPAASMIQREEKEPLSEQDERAMESILELIKEQLPLDFSDYKRSTIFRRISRRMALQGISSGEAYLAYLKENRVELKALAKDFLISVTAFFRDKAAFEIIESRIIPTIIDSGTDPLKIWVAGCATGEEAYSLSILVQEYLDRTGGTREVKIFASDLDEAALTIASKGVYGESIRKDLSAQRLERFFTRTPDGGFKIKDHLRKMLIFAHHDLTKNPPYCHIDLLCCRNLLIYLAPALQKKVFSLLHFGLRQGGYLFLGSSEHAPLGENQFVEIDKKSKIYQKTSSGHTPLFDAFSLPQVMEPRAIEGRTREGSFSQSHRQALSANGQPGASGAGKLPLALLPGNYLSESVINALLEHYGQVGVCLDENRRVVQAFGDLSPFLHSKVFNFNLVELLPEPLLVAFGTAFNQAMLSGKPTSIRGIPNEVNPSIPIHLLILPFLAAKTDQRLLLLLLSPDRLPPAKEGEEREFDLDGHRKEYITFLEEELYASKENLQAASQQLVAYSENMQSFNEELLSAGEEMQSSNEELQSVNEELHTINIEYGLKIKELTELNDDLNNYFRSNVSGQLFVDKSLLLRKFSPAAIQHINLQESDIGRPLHHLTTNIRFDTLVDDIRQVIEQGDILTKELQATTGRWFQVRVMPYLRQADNRPDGAMVTFYDINELVEARETMKAYAAQLTATNEQLSRINQDLDTFVYTASHDLRSPLNSLKGLVGILTSTLKDQVAETDSKLLEMVDYSVAKLLGVITDLTQIAKAQQDMDLEKERVDVQEMLEEVLTSLKEQIAQSGVVILTGIKVQKLLYARKNLRSILYNLISNAIKYRSPDRVPHVEISFQMRENSPVLTVADNGLGLNPEQVSKLFSAFKRFHDHVEGTGIGLYMIKRIVENNDGHIKVESKEGEGTSFRVDLGQPSAIG